MDQFSFIVSYLMVFLKKKINFTCFIHLTLHLTIKEALGHAPPSPYYGKFIGKLNQYDHGIKGSVYAVDESTIYIKGFEYDGTGPDAYFWVGKTARPSPEGYIIPYPEEYNGLNPPTLQAHNKSNIILRLPMGKRIKDIRWLAIWCPRFTFDLGEVFIPIGLDVPKPRVLQEFKRIAHGVRSSNVSVLDAKTFYVPNFHFDGEIESYFWAGNGSEPNIMGIKVPNEMGLYESLRAYQGEDIEIQLPGSLTVHNIDWISIWSISYRQNFGHVLIPKDLLDVPPALGQTKLTPPWWYKPTTTTTSTTTSPKIKNCRTLLPKRMQIKWEIGNSFIEIELLGRILKDQFMLLGFSKSSNIEEDGADAIIVYYNSLLNTFVIEDYFISQLGDCDGKYGLCLDSNYGGKNDLILLNSDRKNNTTRIKFKRPLQTNEPYADEDLILSSHMTVFASIGVLNSDQRPRIFGDFSKVIQKAIKINFSEMEDDDCHVNLYTITEEIPFWSENVLQDVEIFHVKVGPNLDRKNKVIYDNELSDVVYYINNLMTPEIVVERGKSYTFVVETGMEQQNPRRYYPFYITNAPESNVKHIDELKNYELFLGLEKDSEGNLIPYGIGRFCNYRIDFDMPLQHLSTNEITSSLKVECEPGSPGYLNWTVPLDSPNLLYYQCFSERNMGWRITVLNQTTLSDSAYRNTNINNFIITMSLIPSFFISTQQLFVF